MLLSGMLLHRSLSKPPGVYVKRKLYGIGWPYLLWSSIILGLIAATSVFSGSTVTVDTWLQIFYDPPTHLWYLAYLLLFYFICLLLNAKMRTVVFFVALIGSAVLPLDWQRFSFMLSCFLVGDLIRRNETKWNFYAGSNFILIASLISATSYFVASARGVELRYETISLLGVLASTVLCARFMSRQKCSHLGTFVEFVGRNSIVFYVTHWPVMLVVFNLLYMLPSLRHEWTLFVGVVLASLVTGLVMSWLSVRSWLVSALYSWPRAMPWDSQHHRR